MTRFILTICLLLFAALPLCAQDATNDVIIMKDGQEIKATIFKVDDNSVHYRIPSESVEYQVSKQKVREIRFASGRSETFQDETPLANQQTFYRIEQVNDDFFINHTYCEQNWEYARLVKRQWRLNGWKKFCNIFGTIMVFSGAICFLEAMKEDDLSSDDATYYKTQGALGLIYGTASYIVAGSLYRKRDATRKEIMRINGTGLPVSEYRVGGVSLEPSVNLLTDRETHDHAWGAGLRLTF